MMFDEDFLRYCVKRKWDGETEHVHLDVGPSTVVEIEKVFGPLIACSVRVRLDYHAGQWVIERECIRNKHTVPRMGGHVDSLIYDDCQAIFWEEVIRFDCQDSIDFNDI